MTAAPRVCSVFFTAGVSQLSSPACAQLIESSTVTIGSSWTSSPVGNFAIATATSIGIVGIPAACT
jgi:hypothetical protein